MALEGLRAAWTRPVLATAPRHLPRRPITSLRSSGSALRLIRCRGEGGMMRIRVVGLLFIVTFLCAWVASSGRIPTASASHTVPVTVTITSVDGIGDDLDGIGRDGPDFYAGVEFAGGPRLAGNSFATHVDDQNNITPFWTISSNVVVVDDT